MDLHDRKDLHSRPVPDLDPAHGPGFAEARVRAECAIAETPTDVIGAPIPGGKNGSHEIRVGTASWTDPTMTRAGVFYPAGTSSAGNDLGTAGHIILVLAALYLVEQIAGRMRTADDIVDAAAGYAASDIIEGLLKSAVGRERPMVSGNPEQFHPFHGSPRLPLVSIRPPGAHLLARRSGRDRFTRRPGSRARNQRDGARGLAAHTRRPALDQRRYRRRAARRFRQQRSGASATTTTRASVWIVRRSPRAQACTPPRRKRAHGSPRYCQFSHRRDQVDPLLPASHDHRALAL